MREIQREQFFCAARQEPRDGHALLRECRRAECRPAVLVTKIDRGACVDECFDLDEEIDGRRRASITGAA
jgi:hypothetical protein